jgi:hypothetical protein
MGNKPSSFRPEFRFVPGSLVFFRSKNPHKPKRPEFLKEPPASFKGFASFKSQHSSKTCIPQRAPRIIQRVCIFQKPAFFKDLHSSKSQLLSKNLHFSQALASLQSPLPPFKPPASLQKSLNSFFFLKMNVIQMKYNISTLG